jgi:hypothetical protein
VDRAVVKINNVMNPRKKEEVKKIIPKKRVNEI